MKQISWTEHRTNDPKLKELKPASRFLAGVKGRKLQYFGHVVRADDLFTVVHDTKRRRRPRRPWTDDETGD